MASVGRSSRYRFSEKGTTMFSPSAAPRWKIATRILRFLPSTEAARASQEGTAPIPPSPPPSRAEKCVASTWSFYLLWKSGEPSTSDAINGGVRSFAFETLLQ